MLGEAQHLVAALERGHAGAGLHDLAGDVATEHGRELERHHLSRGAAADLPVDRIDAGGGGLDLHLARARPGIGNVAQLELVHVSVVRQHDRPHDCLRSGLPHSAPRPPHYHRRGRLAMRRNPAIPALGFGRSTALPPLLEQALPIEWLL
jgi:hypothetical protein